MSKVAVVGSRDFKDYSFLKDRLDYLLQNVEDITVVSGGANGADKLAAQYAKENGYKLIEFLPDWDAFGKRAGFIRNEQIIAESDTCIAFHKNDSKGTAHSISLAKKKNIPLRVIEI